MEWRDEGVLLSIRKHGETSAIIEVLTAKHGRHAGIVRGGVSRKLKPVLQPGNQVQVDWSARLEAHLGSFRVEPLRSRMAQVMGDRLALEGLNSVCALAGFCLGEREPVDGIYADTQHLLEQIGIVPEWPRTYALWEAALLGQLGYGLDLTCCASNGQTHDLIYVSPKSGRAVCAQEGAPYADRMLPLPEFLKRDDAVSSRSDVVDALRTTGHFFARSVAPDLGRDKLPDARERFLSALRRDV